MTLSTIQWLRSSKASAAASSCALLLALACSSSASAGGPKVALLVVAETNPYFKKMTDAAKAEAAEDGVDLAIMSNKVGDLDDVQSNAIETAVASGVSTILITPAGPGVVPAIRKARAAGVMVLALDNPTTPNDAVDMAYVTNNRDAGQALGKYVATKLAGTPAVIAMLDVFEGKVVQVDIDRDHGFLTGMGNSRDQPERKRRRAEDREVHWWRHLHGRVPPSDPGGGGRRPHRNGKLLVQKSRHQRRLYHQRARCLRRIQGAPGGRKDGRRHRRHV